MQRLLKPSGKSANRGSFADLNETTSAVQEPPFLAVRYDLFYDLSCQIL